MSEGLGGLILGGGYMGYNMYQNYKGFKNMPGNVGYDVNGQTYREDGSVTNAFDMVGAGADTQHKIMTLPDGRKYVQADRKVITGNTPEEWGKNLEDYINDEIRHGKDVIIPTVEGEELTITADTAWKIGDPDTISAVKSNAGTHIDELVETSKKFNEKPPRKDRTDMRFQADKFQYRNAFFKDVDNKYYMLTITSGINEDGNVVYSIGDIKERQFPSVNGSSSNGGALANGNLSYNNGTTNGGQSQEKIIYSDGEVKNTPFADALAGIDTDSLFNNGENDTQKAMPVLNSNAEACVDADNIIAPADKIAQIPTVNRKMLNVWSKRTGAKILIADTGAKFGQESAGAYSRSKDTIVIDWKTATNSDAFARKILTHEGIHSVESSEFYNELRDYAFNNLYADEESKNNAISDKIKQYGKEGVTLDDVGAEKELVADYLSEYILSSEKAINSFCRQNPSLAKNVCWSLKKAYAYLTDEEKFEEIKNIEKGLAIFEKALNTRAMGESDGGGVQYSVSKSFKDQVAETLHTKIDDGNHVYIGETSSILKQVGLNDKPVLITRGHLRDMYHPKVDGVSKYHGLSEPTINELPKILDYPAIVFDSISPNNPDAVCVLSEKLADDGNPILIAIKPDGEGKYNQIKIESNFILTMYGRSGFEYYLKRLGNQTDKILFMDEKRTQALLKAMRLQLPVGLSKLKFNHIIHKTKNVVNTNSKKIIDNDIQFSAPVASVDTKVSAEAESDVKIKSNKAKSYYERYSRTAKKDIGKIFSIPGARLSALDGNFDTLAGEYFHTGKISESSKEALFEKAWKEGIIIDDTNKDFAKALRKDLKSSTLYISQNKNVGEPMSGLSLER